MAINYVAQFKEIDPDGFKVVDELTYWRTRKFFTNARDAFRYAQRRENLGYGVAFAKCGFAYYVWSE